MRITRKQLRRIIREMHDEQGYDAREDERLAAEHGAESDHEQDYKDRRDDAGFEEREGSHIEVHHHHHDQGYDDREDERLGAEHGSEHEHEQDYKDRRDDAGFEKRHESYKRRTLKNRLRKIVRENSGRRRSSARRRR